MLDADVQAIVTYCLQLHTFCQIIIKNHFIWNCKFHLWLCDEWQTFFTKGPKTIGLPKCNKWVSICLGKVQKDSEKIISSIKNIQGKDDMHPILFDKNKMAIYNVTSE